MHWIGIDVGGTFTDAVAYNDATGDMTFAKAASTPANPTRGVLDVLAKLEVDCGDIDRFVHGATIGTNAVLEGKVDEVWMLVTRGFRDVLAIGRTNRPTQTPLSRIPGRADGVLRSVELCETVNRQHREMVRAGAFPSPRKTPETARGAMAGSW